MANTKSAEKAARQARKRQAVNSQRKSSIRTAVRKVEDALAKGDQDAAMKALSAAAPQLQRGAAKGVMHKNAVARKVSRLTKRTKAISK